MTLNKNTMALSAAAFLAASGCSDGVDFGSEKDAMQGPPEGAQKIADVVEIMDNNPDLVLSLDDTRLLVADLQLCHGNMPTAFMIHPEGTDDTELHVHYGRACPKDGETNVIDSFKPESIGNFTWDQNPADYNSLAAAYSFAMEHNKR